MALMQLIDDVHTRVPAQAAPGTRARGEARVSTANGSHEVAVAVRIDARGCRREQYWCDGVRLERHVLLRLTCPETECPHALAVRQQWLSFHRRAPARRVAARPLPAPPVDDQPLGTGTAPVVARAARFPCFTPCPHGAHPPLTIHKTGYDLFEAGACLGGGVTEVGGVRRPRLPSLPAAEAFVLARRLEAQAVLSRVRSPARPGDPPPAD